MDGVKAGVGSIMCSYNRVNNSYGCQNSKLMNGLLKTEMSFQGFVVADWNAQHSGVASALAGLDLVMPYGGYWGDNLTEAVRNSSVPEERVTDMVTRSVPRHLAKLRAQAKPSQNTRSLVSGGPEYYTLG